MEHNRLFKILLLLLEKKKTTAPELAKLFEISVRTVYRDIDRLSSAGIPVYTTTGKYGGIHLMDNYVMDKSLLSEEEQNEILLGLYSVSSIPHLNGNRMLTRLTTLFDHKLDWIEFEHSPWESIPAQEMEMFNQVKQAIFARHPLSFHYVNSNGEASTETAQPVKLIFKNNTWYFKGWQELEQEQSRSFKTFKIKRISDLSFVSGHLDRDPIAPPAEESNAPSPQFPLTEVLFSESVAYRVRDFADPALIRKESDGRLRVAMHLEVDERLYSFLMSFGGDVTVAEPAHIQEELLRRHRRAVKHLIAASGAARENADAERKNQDA
ncbi:helix-turn-helix transcriptional regulator [Saccharibacillus endophyticus]|uniref:DNA-binding transcriptional regulator n=1 Tax=Saccharibacillus endophyticus TaxID=2060666 RepID=A0ABQ1ZVU9_9BACL|nr:YafY family protein [Saccharibacillus endophyticus]GGH80591.1 DNA-binding transcriptional regulator [Saccharibacillus endophyticus]